MKCDVTLIGTLLNGSFSNLVYNICNNPHVFYDVEVGQDETDSEFYYIKFNKRQAEHPAARRILSALVGGLFHNVNQDRRYYFTVKPTSDGKSKLEIKEKE